jgi:hypothetical protein
LAFDNADDFQTQVIDFLRIGLERAGGGRYPSLRGVKRQFQTDVQAYIMTPQKEASAPVAEGQQPTDDTVTYVEGLQYEDMVRGLREEVESILKLKPNTAVIWPYKARNHQSQEGQIALDTTRSGKALYQFDPAHSETHQQARLIFEGDTFSTGTIEIVKGVVYRDVWPRVTPDGLRSLFVVPTNAPQQGLLPCGSQFYDENKVRKHFF